MSGNINMATVLKRLEAVTSRLEDLYEHSGASSGKLNPALCRKYELNLHAGAAAAPASRTLPPPAPAVKAEAVEDPPNVIAFDEQILKAKVQPFVKLTESFAHESVVQQAKLLEKLYTNLGGIIRLAASCKKPDAKSFQGLLTDLQKDIEAITKLKEANWKERDWLNHLSVIADGAPAVAWITLESKPGPYVAETKDATQFYGNRIIKDFKEKDVKHVEWVKAHAAILDDMKKYVLEFHTTGLVWNPKGLSIDAYKASAPAASGAAPAPPPPPPPPPAAPPAPPPPAAAAASGAGGAAAVFAELNRGEDVTKGLRKVDKSEMTHKNPALRASSTVPSSTGPSSAAPKKPVKPSKPRTLQGKKPSKFALEGNKWLIEYQEGESAITVENGEISQIVNLFGCKESTIIVKGKVNAVTIVNCTKTSVLVDSVISSVSVTNSPSFTLQILGSAPSIQIDSTDSGTIYLSKTGLDVGITTAKCSAINVNLPEGDEEGVFDEKALPEMLQTVVKDGKLVTTVVEHIG
ncbi:hypothetical protein FA95DRAFT_1677076 [Auriscalpium vulgare]|uniref:Uncharacterized protein n=1 Tax=Auriscalpium vulgare TaxID=40419 RepID=A0ACB8S230_9AGAM|nr:hypothetical protein FA95DRAFT_1677076 [Auriscalpium vulgare]